MLLEEMVEMFLASRKRGDDGARKKCSPVTIEIYRRNLSIFLNYLQTETKEGGTTTYAAIKRMHIKSLVSWADEKNESGVWSRATVLQLLRALKAFFHWVDADEDCQAMELKGLQRHLPTIEKNPSRKFIPSAEQMRKFKNSFDTDNLWGYRNFVATSLMLTNGMRVGEICNLRIDQMKLDERIIIADGKTGPRLVPITNEVVRLLRGWIKRRGQGHYAVESPYVFISKRGCQMEPNGFGQAFRKHVKDNGLEKATPHTLRHFFATNYLRSGGNILRLKSITGHTSIAMLQDYVHLGDAGSKEAVDDLERYSPLKNL